MTVWPSARLSAVTSESADEKMVSQIFTSWNRIREWLRRLNAIQRVA